ncbi:MAG: hypothetical protein A2033_07530 [Bacteroidetes bacterium GWA2_31_9]|nr:MAG: hypothetical protein A2033_07530 [Bacteroidetes bacterium GWA2_31_9]
MAHFKIKLIILITIFSILFITCKQTKQSEIGVWANKDCELIITNNFVLFFERNGNEISATLQRIEKSGDKLSCKLFSKTIFKDSIVSYKYVNTKMDSLIDKSSIGVIQNDGQIIINSKTKQQLLQLIEPLKIVDNYEMFKVEKNNIGLCLQQWRLGSRLTLDSIPNLISFELGTNKHNYAFVIQDGFIYCRAARIRSYNKGTYFAQNIRLMSNSRENARIMEEDNQKLSSDDLKIDDSKFDSTKCIFDKEGIYWSLIKFDSDTIFLNGCGGDIYPVARDEMTSKTITDWIEFIKY